MKNKSLLLIGLAFSSLWSLAPISVRSADGPYHFLKEIPVGGDGGWDYLSVDEVNRRLYVSHAAKVVVTDLAKEEVVGDIADTPGCSRSCPCARPSARVTSNGRENKASIVDLKTLATLSKVDTGQNPDGMLYEPSQQEVYLFNGRGQSATVVDLKAAKVVATVPLGGKPEFAQADPSAGRVYNNLEDKSEVVAIDIKKHEVVNRWPIAPGESASGMAIDLAHHRLFLGCGNRMMVMMDSTSGKVVVTVPIGRGVDANAFDPGTQLAFSSCGDGTVTIAHEDAPDKLTVVQTLATERGAKTMTLDPKTHRIYLASAKFEAQPEQTPGAPRQRPKVVAGSFKVLI